MSGESYADSHRAVRMGLFEKSIDELRTAYVYPQENGNRSGVHWLDLTSAGSMLHINGDQPFQFAARRWTTEQLEAASHTSELEPGDRVWLNLDLGQTGLGSASCGPGVLPAHRLVAAPASFILRFHVREPN
ncbi:hypothetical protein [Gryllotalpicola koreensis]|uniref:beta-galactosidase n=1 Tax=Gryllotalpicola koreensis TaxID=993086 RepID=A0ABP7ZUL4_9MICO